jgi:succinyl-diaminopimelate desuccinylase
VCSDSAREAAQRAAERTLPAAERWLERWLEIPSISGDPAHRTDVDHAATFLARRLARSAAVVEIRRCRAGPVVLARWCGRSPNALVIYGHLDVKPAGPGWSASAFLPRRKGRRLVARGASDDKGQLLAHILAVESWIVAGGLPRDVIVVVDGAEEIGSPGLRSLLTELRCHQVLAGPVAGVVVSDTKMAAPGVPSLTVAQRGMLGLTVTVDAGGPAVHAGRFGGAVVDPALALAAALDRAASAVSRLRNDRLPPFLRVPDRVVRKAVGGRATHSAYLGLRSTVRGALTVTSLRAGGTSAAVPRRAAAELDVRVPPGIGTDSVRQLVARELSRHDLPPLRTVVQCNAGAPGFIARHTPDTLGSVVRACREGFGRDPVPLASGATIPALRAVETVFGVSPILLGLGPVDDGAHGPDEYLDLVDWARGVRTAVALIDEIPHNSAQRISVPRPGSDKDVFPSAKIRPKE